MKTSSCAAPYAPNSPLRPCRSERSSVLVTSDGGNFDLPPPGVKLPGDEIDSVAAASIIRSTGGNFRLLNRLLTQAERILEINALPTVTKEVVEAARENLVIGQAQKLSAVPFIVLYPEIGVESVN